MTRGRTTIDDDTMANNDPRHARLLLLSQFKSRLSPRSSRFQWPSSRSLLKAQSYLLGDLLQDQNEPQSHKSSTAYQKIFFKELIARIDRAVGALSDEDEWVSHSPIPGCTFSASMLTSRAALSSRKRTQIYCNTTLIS